MAEIRQKIHGNREGENESETAKTRPVDWMVAVDIVAKEHGLQWHEVTRMNVFTFNTKLKFLSYKIKKASSKK